MTTIRTHRLTYALDGLWHTANAPQTFVALALLLAATLAGAALVPQQPAGLDAAGAEAWLAAAAGRYGSAGTLLRTLGMFDLLAGAWLRALLAALAFHLALRLASQGDSLARFRRQGPAPSPAALPIHRATLPLPFLRAVARVETLLRTRYASVTVETDAERAQIYAERMRPGAYGPALAYLGLLLALLGLLLNDAVGWQMAEIALAPGDTATVAQANGLQITLDALPGPAVGGRAAVTLARAGYGKNVRVDYNRPGRWGNLWLAQQATGPALAVAAVESGNRPVLLQSLASDGAVGPTLRVLFRQTQSEQGFAIPARNLTFRAVSFSALPERGIDRPVFLIEAYRGEETAPAFSELVEDEGILTLDDLSLTVQRDRYVIFRAAYLPGLIPLALGGLLTLAGVVLAAFWGPVRAWVGLAATRDTTAVALRCVAPALALSDADRLLEALQTPEAIAAEAVHGN